MNFLAALYTGRSGPGFRLPLRKNKIKSVKEGQCVAGFGCAKVLVYSCQLKPHLTREGLLDFPFPNQWRGGVVPKVPSGAVTAINRNFLHT